MQMNLADSERMAGTLESAGYTCAEDVSDADVIVYNTCSIRDKVRGPLLGPLLPSSYSASKSFWRSPFLTRKGDVDIDNVLILS